MLALFKKKSLKTPKG